MSRRRANPRVEADVLAMRHEPFRAGEQILLVLRLRGDAGKAQVVAKFREKTFLVLFQVIENRLHGR